MSTSLLIFFTVVIACMATVLFFTIKANLKLQKELSDIQVDMFKLNTKLQVTQDECQSLREGRAWRKGMEAGRKTDTLYRQILKKYTGDQQFTVMINGVEEDELK